MPSEQEIRQTASSHWKSWNDWESNARAFARSEKLPSTPAELPVVPFGNKGEQKTHFTILIPPEARGDKRQFCFYVVLAVIDAVRDVYPDILIGRSGDMLVFSKTIGQHHAFVQIELVVDGNLVNINVFYQIIEIRDGHKGDVALHLAAKPRLQGKRLFISTLIKEFVFGLYFLAAAIPMLAIAMFFILCLAANNGEEYKQLALCVLPCPFLGLLWFTFLEWGDLRFASWRLPVKLLMGGFAPSILLIMTLGILTNLMCFVLGGNDYLPIVSSVLSILALVCGLSYVLLISPLRTASQVVRNHNRRIVSESKSGNDRMLQNFEDNSFRIFIADDSESLFNSYGHRGFFNQFCEVLKVLTARFYRGNQ